MTNVIIKYPLLGAGCVKIGQVKNKLDLFTCKCWRQRKNA